MRVKILQNLNDPQPLEVEAGMVVVTMDDGTPVMVGCRYGLKETIVVAHCNDPEFQQLLRKLKINQTVVVKDLNAMLKRPEELTPLIRG